MTATYCAGSPPYTASLIGDGVYFLALAWAAARAAGPAGAGLVMAVGAGSAGIGALALAPDPSAVALALLSGLVCGICGGLAIAFIQTATDPSYLGRVSSVTAFTAVGLAPLAYPLAGAMADLWSIAPLFLADAALSMAGAVVGTSAPAVRRAELAFAA